MRRAPKGLNLKKITKTGTLCQLHTIYLSDANSEKGNKPLNTVIHNQLRLVNSPGDTQFCTHWRTWGSSVGMFQQSILKNKFRYNLEKKNPSVVTQQLLSLLNKGIKKNGMASATHLTMAPFFLPPLHPPSIKI